MAETIGVGDDTRDVAAAQRDPAAFAVLYDRYVDAVFGYCLFRLWDRGDAEDATSQIFVKAFEALPRYRPHGDSFRPWLFTIAHNVVVNAHRDRKVHRSLEDAINVVAPVLGPDDEAIRSDERRRVRLASEQLTDDQRNVVELRMAGLTGDEVAATLNKSLPAVKMLQVRAIDRLQELLSDGREIR